MPEILPILFQDEHLVAINKPSGLLVHRSAIDRHETRFAMQILRDQLGRHVFPVHRLDKPTSGVLLFALSSDCAQKTGEIFARHKIQKTYLAIVRGFAPERSIIDYPLREKRDACSDRKMREDKPAQSAITEFQRLGTVELPISIDKYPSSRYSLVSCQPLTGRKHQIRRHLKHMNHPIIGDAKHGKGQHNRFFQQELAAPRLLLAATELNLLHPYTGENLNLIAPLDDVFQRLLRAFDWYNAIPKSWLGNTHNAAG